MLEDETERLAFDLMPCCQTLGDAIQWQHWRNENLNSLTGFESSSCSPDLICQPNGSAIYLRTIITDRIQIRANGAGCQIDSWQ